MTVVAGSRLPDPLAAEISRRGLHRDVVLPGWVSDDQLEALFQVATLYVCPSLAEGFGLPIVDALRRGVAVVANDIPVLREVGGSVARYAPVDDADAFSAAIMDSINAPISAQGRAAACIWAAQFTWDGAAENTASFLRATLDETESRTAQ
jgi:glycosyltransferase involved in cell wall biosynthesis